MKLRALALMLIVMLMSGCALSRQPENQAYAISMSVDLEDDGQITLGVQVPAIGAQSVSSDGEDGGGGGGGGGGGSDSQGYVVYATTGASFPEALDLLQNTVSRHLKLMQLKSIVFSEKLARSSEFGRIVDQMMMTYYIYGSAFVMMSKGDALEFLEKQQPTIGIRLSSSLSATLEHFFMGGYVTYTSLTGLYASNHSFYSDPMITVVDNAPKDSLDITPIAPDKMGETIAGGVPRKGNTENEYMGSALLRDGRVVALLDGLQSQWFAVLTKDVNALNYMCNGSAMQLNVLDAPDFTLNLREDGVDVALDIRFECMPLLEAPDIDALRQKIADEIRDLITHCQSAGVEPFHLSELAANHFLTIPAYQQYHFREKFCASDVKISVDVQLHKL